MSARLVQWRRRRGAPGWSRVVRAGLSTLLVTLVTVGSAVGLGAVSASPAGASGAVVTGTGSSYAAVAINQWVGQTEQLYGDSINYSTQSSVIGLDYFAQGQVNFGASEIGYSTGQANEVPPAGEAYQYMPDVAGAICLMYNLTDKTQAPVTTLKMTPGTIFGIFTGQVRFWDDPSIAQANPGVLLPHSPIVPVYRTDASGDNYIFSDYFDTLDASQWNQFAVTLGFPAGPTAIWPTPQAGGLTVGPYNFSNWIGENGSDNASNYVNGNGGSLTYVETAYAIEHNRKCVQVENQSGNFLAPSEVGDALALQSDQLAPDLEQNLTGVFETPNPNAYPISAYSYLITQEQEMPPSIGAVLGQFVKFMACRGQQAAGELGYAPIPPNLVQDDFDSITRMAGATNPGPLTAANCPNPYLLCPTCLPGYSQPTGPPASGGGGLVTTKTTAPATSTGPNPAAVVITPSSTGPGGGGGGSSGHSSGGPAANSSTSTKSPLSDFGHTKGVPKLKETGQPRSIALFNASAQLAAYSGPTGTAIMWTLIFIGALVVVPATVYLLRKRRRLGTRGAQ